MAFVSVFMFYTVIQFVEVFKADQTYNTVTEVVDLLTSEKLTAAKTLEYFDPNFLKEFQVRLDPKFNVTCEELTMQFWDNSEPHQNLISDNFTYFTGTDPILCKYNFSAS